MPWGEAIRLIEVLRIDTSSRFAAAMEGWDYPISRETLATLDVFDLLAQVNSKRKPKEHPGRPFHRQRVRKMGDPGGRTPRQVRDLLERAKKGEAA